MAIGYGYGTLSCEIETTSSSNRQALVSDNICGNGSKHIGPLRTANGGTYIFVKNLFVTQVFNVQMDSVASIDWWSRFYLCSFIDQFQLQLLFDIFFSISHFPDKVCSWRNLLTFLFFFMLKMKQFCLNRSNLEYDTRSDLLHFPSIS